MRAGTAIGYVVCLVLAVTGCSGAQPVPVPGDPSSSAAPVSTPTAVESSLTIARQSATHAEPDGPAGDSLDVEYSGVPIHLEFDPVRVMDDVALLSLDYSLVAGAASPRVSIEKVSAMWPEPGRDTVAIDVPDRRRITGVPVTP